MASFVSMSWSKCVETRLTWTSAITMSSSVQIILEQSLNFWKRRDTFSQQILKIIALPLGPIFAQGITTHKRERSVGVRGNLNCNQLICCGRLAKKNTQISSLDVLDAVCTRCDHSGNVVSPNVAHCKNTCNLFAECYV